MSPSLREKIWAWDAKFKSLIAVTEEEEGPEIVGNGPTWTEVALLALGGSLSILGGLMFTGLYYIFYPVPYAFGFIVYMAGLIFTGLFFWSMDDNAKRAKKQNQRPPSKASNGRDEQERTCRDSEERKLLLAQDPTDSFGEKQARHEHV